MSGSPSSIASQPSESPSRTLSRKKTPQRLQHVQSLELCNRAGPDPFGRDQGSLTTEQWQALLFSRWTARGGQSISYYTQLAESLGLSIEIYEPDPPVYGTFCWGDGTVFGTPENDLWVWQVTLPQPGTGLEAVFLTNRQPDVEVVFRYASGSGFGNYAFNQLPFGN